VFPGALSLTEMHQAFDLGATMVKLFPSEVFGPEYLRFIVESFPEWRLMPTGGVSVETLSFYRQAGARAFGVGTPLFDRRQIRARNWAWIGEQVQRFARAFRESQPVPSDA
jgi:2-dehydro-3-deoxyphosphogluconate aldolase/(4S)-4-hydroxy-2-oxoglutarate aldolase